MPPGRPSLVDRLRLRRASALAEAGKAPGRPRGRESHSDALLREARHLIADLQRERDKLGKELNRALRELDEVDEERDDLLDAVQRLRAAFEQKQGHAAPTPASDPWATLGLLPTAEPAAAKAAYRALVERHHPDKGGSASRTAEINAAWTVVERAIEARRNVS